MFRSVVTRFQPFINRKMSSACCSIPPVIDQTNYKPKGTYEKLGNFNKAYITGPKDAETAVIGIYDIFG